MATLGAQSAKLSTSVTSDPVRGFSVVQVYSGTYEKMAELKALCAPDQITILDDSQAPLWKLYIQTPDDPENSASTTSVNTYEVVPNQHNRDGYESARARALGSTVLLDIRKRIDNKESGSGLSGDALKFYNLMAKGQARWDEEMYVFRFTKIVSPRYTIKMAFSNRGKIYTTAQVSNEVQPPSDILFSLDDINADSTVGGPANIPESSTEAGTIYGWRKGAPSGQLIAGNKFAITQEFVQCEASTFYYSAATL